MSSVPTLILKPYLLKKGKQIPRVALIPGDMHYPFQHPDAVTLMRRAALDAGVNTVIYQGDTLDLYNVSRFSKNYDSNPKGLKAELGSVNEEFEWGCKAAGAGDVIFIEGNHENRWDKFVKENVAFTGMTLRDMVQPNPKVQWLGNRARVCVNDDFVVEHGDHLKGALSRHGPYTVANTYGFQTTVYGHAHKVGMSLLTKFLPKGSPEITGAYCVGHMADTRKLDYIRDSQSQMGFGLVTWYQTGNKKRWRHRVDLVHIDLDTAWKPSFCLHGKVYV